MAIQHRPGRPRPWRARLRTADGREVSKSFARKVDAEAWLAEQRTDMRRGDWVDPSRGSILWEEYVEIVLAGKSHLAPRTVETYRDTARRVLPFLEGTALNRITAERLESVVSTLSGMYAPETVAKSVRLIRMVLGKAVVHRRLMRSPAADLAAPKPERRSMRILSVAEVEAVAEALPPRYRSLPIVAAYMGLRFGELAGLSVDAVDMLRRRLEVRQSVIEPRGQPPRIGPVKSAASARTLAIPANVIDALASHLEAYPPAGGLVWTTEAGQLLRRGSFGRIWRRAVDASVGRPCRLHDLRHTHAAWLIALGEHPKTIQQRLGHASIQVTLDRYGHLMEGLDDAAAERLSDLSRGSKSSRVGASVMPLHGAP